MRCGMEEHFKNVILSRRFKDKYCYHSAKRGELDSLIWARANGCEWNSDTCKAAARGGHLACLKWAFHEFLV